jgi:hypothetical protein
MLERDRIYARYHLSIGDIGPFVEFLRDTLQGRSDAQVVDLHETRGSNRGVCGVPKRWLLPIVSQ